ncbi:hypothetical protein [Halalkalibacter urbisdiaboli]|uniref:hypothetical protein n=1 Tax=Halalkalibacter urbisdiaboli TaxID=1960589 RepID=UPI000B42DD8A|nr:hypothetical protein [Halalkalibacter urbisdiaboli]
MKAFISALALCLLLLGCGTSEETPEQESPPPEEEPSENGEEPNENMEEDELNHNEDDSELAPAEAADQIVEALKNKEMSTLAQYIHATKGVRFTPYGYVDPESDLVFESHELTTLLEDDTKYVWGHFDGTGEPIELTFAEYYERFVYDQDYLNADEKSVNERLGHGNSLDNSQEIYPEATVIEYHFPEIDEQYEGMDWKSLRIVIEKEEGEWKLLGIIHDEWTI